MSARQVALPVAVVTCVAGAFRILQSFAPVLLDSRISLGLSAFVFAGTFVSFLLNPGVVLAIAYRASDTVDIPREWSSIAAWAFVAAVVGYLVGGSLGIGLVAFLRDISPTGRLGLLVNVGLTALFGGVRAALAGVAGASVGHFRRA